MLFIIFFSWLFFCVMLFICFWRFVIFKFSLEFFFIKSEWIFLMFLMCCRILCVIDLFEVLGIKVYINMYKKDV